MSIPVVYPPRFAHRGTIKVYKDGRVIYSRKFLCKKTLIELLGTYKHMEIGVIYNAKVFDDSKRYPGI